MAQLVLVNRSEAGSVSNLVPDRFLPTFGNSFVACGGPKVLHAPALNVTKNDRSGPAVCWNFGCHIHTLTYMCIFTYRTRQMSLCIKSEIGTYPMFVRMHMNVHTHDVEYPAHLIRLQPVETKPFPCVFWRQTSNNPPLPTQLHLNRTSEGLLDHVKLLCRRDCMNFEPGPRWDLA